MKKFLNQIWGDAEGFRCISTNPKSGFKDTFISETALLPDFETTVNKQIDIWYAPSVFHSKKRGKDNVKSVKALWLDIDVKDGNYKTIEDAINALHGFIERYNFPIPTLVNSGNGLHAYWILKDETFSPAEWMEYAQAIREACIESEFQADHSITIDIARILRVPQTKNFKDKTNPKDVEIWGDLTTTTKEKLREILDPFILKNKMKAEAKEFNKQFVTDLPNSPKDALLITTKCGQMSAFYESKGNLPEPQWYAALGVLALCENGESLAHEWSSGFPKYSERETQEKFERAVEFAPTTCAKFEGVAPEICRACPHFGKISSPIQLGEKVTPVEITVERVIDSQPIGEEALPVPRYYEVGKEGVYTLATEETPRKLILSQPLWVSRVMVTENGAGSEIEIVWLNTKGRRRMASFKQSLLAQDATFAVWLLDNNIHGFNSIKNVVLYIRAGISRISHEYEEEIVYNKFGFSEAGFVIGEDVITESGRLRARISEEIDHKKVELLKTKGSAEKWSEASKLFDKPELWMHRFTILAALGTPLLGMSGSEGSVLSLAGESSTGKTTAANFGAAAYGNPKAFTVDPQSTLNAFYENWRIAGQLPVICNEAATIQSYSLKEIVYAAANGKARDRLTRSGKMKDSGGWQTLTIFTSNTHLLALSDKILSEATRRRILELSFDVENKISLTDGMKINAAIKHNYGDAGRIFLDSVMQNRDAIAIQVRQRVDELQRGIDSVHRYNIWLIAIASVTAELATALGLIRFGTDDAIRNAVALLQNQNATQKSTIEQISDAIGRYANEFQNQIGAKSTLVNGAWVVEPHNESKGRYDVDTSGEAVEFFLPITLFKEWALERGLDINQIRQYVKENHIKTANQRISRFGKPTACYVLPQKKEADNN